MGRLAGVTGHFSDEKLPEFSQVPVAHEAGQSLEKIAKKSALGEALRNPLDIEKLDGDTRRKSAIIFANSCTLIATRTDGYYRRFCANHALEKLPVAVDFFEFRSLKPAPDIFSRVFLCFLPFRKRCQP